MTIANITIDEAKYQQAIQKLQRFGDGISQYVDNGAEWAAYKFAEELAQNVPIETGGLQDTIDVSQTDTSTYTVTIGDNEHPAKLLEFGCGPHEITPKHAKALAFEIEGETVFAKKVHHPGTPPRPFFQPTLENVADQISATLAGGLENLVDTGETEIQA